jgi:hypothetical protein
VGERLRGDSVRSAGREHELVPVSMDWYTDR